MKLVALRDTTEKIVRTARETAMRTLTREERRMVRAVENDERLFELFDEVQRDFLRTRWFAPPVGLSPYEERALRAMHRYVDEMTYLASTLHDVRVFVDDFNFGRDQASA